VLCLSRLPSCFLAQELLAAKHPTAWVEFEKDQITQQQLFDKFFADGRQFDGQALIQHMVSEPSSVPPYSILLWGRLEHASAESNTTPQLAYCQLAVFSTGCQPTSKQHLHSSLACLCN
jgi:hypothetical protein